MTYEEAYKALVDLGFQRRRQAKARDQLVRDALAAGLTKKTIHEVSGIARTTIDRIIKGEQ